MADRDQVIKGLQCIIDGTVQCESCGYAIDKHGHHSCRRNCASDAIALLKEQEPMKPKEVFQDGSYYATCGDCGYPITELTRQHGWPRFDWPPFCSNCGRQVKWDADREKVIKALRLCLIMDFSGRTCMKCPYFKESNCNGKLLDEALVLLRGEPVKPDCRHAEYDGWGCLGYAKSLHDDEPIDICKSCDAYTGNREES